MYKMSVQFIFLCFWLTTTSRVSIRSLRKSDWKWMFRVVFNAKVTIMQLWFLLRRIIICCQYLSRHSFSCAVTIFQFSSCPVTTFLFFISLFNFSFSCPVTIFQFFIWCHTVCVLIGSLFMLSVKAFSFISDVSE